MDRLTEHHVRVIRVALILFASLATAFYSYEVGAYLYEMRQPENKNLSMTNYLLQNIDVLEKSKHQPYELRSFIATCLICVVLINVGLLVGVAKQCKVLLKVWLVQAGVMCFLGVYLTILETFGSRVPLYGEGVLTFFGVLLYLFVMGLVWIFHERGEDLETIIRTHRLVSSEEDLRNEFNP